MTTARWSYATGCQQRARRLALFGQPQWNGESAGLPRAYGGGVPPAMRATGVHTYGGKAYYVRCRFNGCRPWNRVAFERAEVRAAG